jgi:predicted metal-binding membrane protein
VSHGESGSLAALVLAWWSMMAVTMLPVTWPWMRALHRVASGGADGSSTAMLVPMFAAGYLAVWLAFSVGAASFQTMLSVLGEPTGVLQGALLAGAGLYQLTPVKGACLERCRSPLSLVLTRWPLSAGGAARLGAEHGLFCLGCCWALMLLGLFAGTAGWLWMAGVTVLVAVEKLTPWGPRVGRWAGAALLSSAILIAVR